MHNDPEYVEHQDGPEGQFCDLLTRLPYDRQRMIEIALASAKTQRDMEDAALRGLLWSASVKHSLTGEMTDEFSVGAAEVIDPWRKRAVVLYNAWYEQAMPGPKGSTRKPGSLIQRSGKTAKASATSGRG